MKRRYEIGEDQYTRIRLNSMLWFPRSSATWWGLPVFHDRKYLVFGTKNLDKYLFLLIKKIL